MVFASLASSYSITMMKGETERRVRCSNKRRRRSGRYPGFLPEDCEQWGQIRGTNTLILHAGQKWDARGPGIPVHAYSWRQMSDKARFMKEDHMQLTLAPQEQEVLSRVVESAISDLGTEIRHTDNQAMRHDLQERKGVLLAILDRLRGTT